MRRRIGIFVCSVLAGVMATGCMMIPEVLQVDTAEVAQTGMPDHEPVMTMAWWSLTYEMPNPEKLPVKVQFQCLKGLE